MIFHHFTVISVCNCGQTDSLIVKLLLSAYSANKPLLIFHASFTHLLVLMSSKKKLNIQRHNEQKLAYQNDKLVNLPSLLIWPKIHSGSTKKSYSNRLVFAYISTRNRNTISSDTFIFIQSYQFDQRDLHVHTISASNIYLEATITRIDLFNRSVEVFWNGISIDRCWLCLKVIT